MIGVLYMTYTIIVDSCCDLSQQLKQELNAVTIPLNLTLGSKEIIDEETLDVAAFLEEMKACPDRIGSSAPSPALYQQAYEQAKHAFVVTLSSKLSSSYSSAMLGKDMMETDDSHIHIFDSKSASAGEVLIAIKIKELIQQGHTKERIIQQVDEFIADMKTYFVLDNIDNLLKNGRLSKIKGKLITLFNVKPLLGSDGDGNIVHYSTVKGQAKIVKKLVDTITTSGKTTEGTNAVISHCNNPLLAEKLKTAINEQFNFKEIIVVPTGGLSSLYANDKGIILAF